MLGAVAGDVIGSVHEFARCKTKDFPLFVEASTFTDDTVLTVAVAEAILTDRDYEASVRRIGRRYPNSGYGGSFMGWLVRGDAGPYNSWGNGAAMRVSPVGFAFDEADTVLAEAKRTAEFTHNHPEGIKGAQATALAMLLARQGADKTAIRSEITRRFGYDLDRTVDGIRPDYAFNESCQATVPEALAAFLDSDSFEDAVRNAVSLGGDADTLACIAGGVAEAFYKSIPDAILREVLGRLTDDLRGVALAFYKRYGLPEIRERLGALESGGSAP
jgi:ADP-ribosylglycohydrolase